MSSSITGAPAGLPTGAPSIGVPKRGFVMFLKFWTLGVILSSIAYGIAFTLFAACIYLLKKTTISKREPIHYALMGYITLMFALSTVSIVSGISTNLNAITTQSIPTNLNIGANADAVVIVLANWGSDGFLLWRACVLYESVTASKRRAVNALVIFMGVAQVATGVMYLLSNFIKSMNPVEISKPIFIAFASTTLFVNWVITALVVLRLWFFRRRVSKTLGNAYGSPYTGIISMCVESAALVIFFATIFLTLNLMGKNPFSFSRAFLVHIYVIAPLLILYRVAQGKAWLTNSTSFYNHQDSCNTSRSGNPPTTLRFNRAGVSSTGQSTKIDVTVTHDEISTYYNEDLEMEGVKSQRYHDQSTVIVPISSNNGEHDLDSKNSRPL